MLKAPYVKKSHALVLASLMLAGSTISVFAEEADLTAQIAVEAAADPSSEEVLIEQDEEAAPAEEAVEDLAVVESTASEAPDISEIIIEEADSDEIMDIEEAQFTLEDAFEPEAQAVTAGRAAF